MAKFIEVTIPEGQFHHMKLSSYIYVNADKIKYLESSRSNERVNSIITMDDGSKLSVTETCDDIVKLINK